MSFQRPRRTDDRAIDDAVANYFARESAATDKPYGDPTALQRGTIQAKFGDVILVDGTQSDIVVQLPDGARSDIGGSVTVKNLSAGTNDITVRGKNTSVLIDGAATDILDRAWGGSVYMYLDVDTWGLVESGQLAVERWKYIEADQPTGVTTTAEALWKFTGELPECSGSPAAFVYDLTGNGHTLAASGANVRFATIEDIVVGGFNESNSLFNSSPGNLRMLGDMTVEVVAQLQDISGNNDVLVCMGAGAPDVEANNYVYQWLALADTGRWRYFGEYGAGVNAGINTAAMMACNGLQHYCLVRESGSTQVKVYVNGLLSDTASYAANPTGGTAGTFRIGLSAEADQVFHGFIQSMKITAAAYTAAQVLEAYERVRITETSDRTVYVPGVGTGHIIEEDGLPLPQRTTLDFIEGATSDNSRWDLQDDSVNDKTKITLNSALARLDQTETISGFWTFDPTFPYTPNAYPSNDRDVANKAYVDLLTSSGPTIGQRVTVGKSGNVEHNTIAAGIAAASALSPSATNRIIVEIWPGEYNETITVPGWVSLVGRGQAQDVVVWSNTGNVVTLTASIGTPKQQTQIANMTVRSSPTAPGARCIFFSQGGEIFVNNVDIEYLPTNTYGTAIDVDVGSIMFRGIRGYYTHTGTGGGNHVFIDVNQLAGVIGVAAEVEMTVAADDDVYGYLSQAVVNDAADIVSTHMDITVSHASYSSNCYGIYHTGPANNIHFNSGRIGIKATGGSVTGTAWGVYLGHASAEISSIGSKIEVTGFATNYHAGGTAGTLLTHFDLVTAADGVDTTSITWKYSYTGSDGDFTVFGTVYLDNDGGECIVLPTAAGTFAATHYRFNVGGGGAFTNNPDNEGGTFTIAFEDIGAQLGTAVNQFIVDLGKPDPLANNTFNDYIIQCDNYQATYGFVSRFANFNNTAGFGWSLEVLDAHPGEPRGRQLFFDNNVTFSDVNRSIDFRIATVNKLTIENSGEVIAHDRFTTPRATITSIDSGVGFGTAGVNAVTLVGYKNFAGLNWFDLAEFRGLTTDLPMAMAVYPNGTATDSFINVYNSSSISATAWLSVEMMGATASMVIRDYLQTTDVTAFNIGSGGNDFPTVDVTCSTLVDINFIFAGVTECTINQDAFVMNNGATDTQIDWGTDGELGLQVATNDIIRLTATQAQVIQDLVMSEGVIFSTTRETGSVTITTDETVCFADSDGGDMTITLPAGVEGAYHKIINCGASGNTVTVDGDSAETVMGALTQDLADGEVIELHYNATEGWW